MIEEIRKDLADIRRRLAKHQKSCPEYQRYMDGSADESCFMCSRLTQKKDDLYYNLGEFEGEERAEGTVA